jgi:hypothetical protein
MPFCGRTQRSAKPSRQQTSEPVAQRGSRATTPDTEEGFRAYTVLNKPLARWLKNVAMLFTHIWTSPPAVAGLVTIHTTISIPMNQPRIFPIKRPPPGRAAQAQNKAANCLPAGTQILMTRSADSGPRLTHNDSSIAGNGRAQIRPDRIFLWTRLLLHECRVCGRTRNPQQPPDSRTITVCPGRTRWVHISPFRG